MFESGGEVLNTNHSVALFTRWPFVAADDRAWSQLSTHFTHLSTNTSRNSNRTPYISSAVKEVRFFYAKQVHVRADRRLRTLITTGPLLFLANTVIFSTGPSFSPSASRSASSSSPNLALF